MEQIPVNDDAERAVLGAALSNEAAAYETVEKLNIDDFYSGRHQNVYEAVACLVGAGVKPDIITVEEWLSKNQKAGIGTIEYLADLTSEFISRSALPAHIGIVKEKSERRAMLMACREAAQKCMDVTQSPADIKAELCNLIYALDDKHEDVKSMRAAYAEAYVDICKAVKAKENGGTDGIMSGIPTLDKKIGGWRPGELIVLGARPSVGKTSMALNWANKAQSQTTVLLFSLEMQSAPLAMRQMAVDTSVPLSDMRGGNVDEMQIKRISKAIQRVGGNMFISDTFSQSTADMMATAQLIRHKHGLGMVVIDYLQLIRPVEHSESEVRALNAITRNLKIMAGELNVPVILLSQLSRNSEYGKEKPREPRLSDLRGSGSIEQDADIVIFLHKETLAETEADLIIAKHRNGPTGKIRLNWDGEKTLFTEQETFRAYEGPIPFGGAS